MPRLIPSESMARRAARWITDAFGVLYYSDHRSFTLNWMGVPMYKCPCDLFAYQEILFETRPDLIIETGTYKGGSALFLAHVCELLGQGRVLTIDIAEVPDPPRHSRLQYLRGSSVAEETGRAVRDQIRPGDRVMVILDSDHGMSHVLRELRIFGQLVTAGCYLIVEDTNVNGHPVLSSHGPGPTEALEEFLKENQGFEVDHSRERFRLTFNPGGYLRRIPT